MTKQKKQAATPKRKAQDQRNGTAAKVKILLPLLIALPLIFIVFSPILDNEFTNWDDPGYIIENAMIRHLDGASLHKMFTQYSLGNYTPIHFLAIAIQYQFFQDKPGGYHATSLLIYLLSCGLIYFFLYQLSGKRSTALIATLLFSLHPLRVESVAWVAEQKDLLYLMFYAAALIAYLRYISSGKKPAYLVLTFILFQCSLFSKVSAVSFVGAMVMLDYYYGRRFSVRNAAEKLPFIASSLWSGYMEILATRATDAFTGLHVLTFFDRIIVAGRNLLYYFFKLLLPVNLSAYYPYPVKSDGGMLPMEYYALFLCAVALVILVATTYKRTKLFVFTFGFFFVTIVLFLQVIAVGATIASERYALVPAIAFSFFLAMGVDRLVKNHAKYSKGIYAGLAVYMSFLVFATFTRCDVWQTSLTLWNDVLKQFPTVATALNNRGDYYRRTLKEYDRAMEDYNLAIQCDPKLEISYVNRGMIYATRKDFLKAETDFTKALSLRPDYPDALLNRGMAYAEAGLHEKAVEEFTHALTVTPESGQLFFFRGLSNTQIKRYNAAISDFTRTAQLNPNNGDAYYWRAVAYFNMGKKREAQSDAQTAVQLGARIDPNFLQLLGNAK
jgi:protein O-mannosyl-transferase